MVRILRIAAISSLGFSVVFMVFLAFKAFGGNVGAEQFFQTQSAIEKFKTRDVTTSKDENQTSPLIKQAGKLARRLNPPPPPKPPKPKKQQTKTQVIQPKKVESVKFDLVATCYYQDTPQKSLALLNMPAEGLKWYRQGEKVGRIVIDQIKEGSIICGDGKGKEEVFMPNPVKKSLLKSQAGGVVESKPESTKLEYTPLKQTKTTQAKPTRPKTTRRTSSRRVTIRSKEEKEKMREQNIADVKKLIAESEKNQVSGKEAEDLNALGKLLKKLEKGEPQPQKRTPTSIREKIITSKQREPNNSQE